MKLLIINQFGKGEIVEAQAIPHKGTQVDMFCKPNPRVTEVIMWPSKETLAGLQAENFHIEALVLVT